MVHLFYIQMKLQAQEGAEYLIGYGKADITYTCDNIGLFGNGSYHHRIADSENGCSSPIFSRVVSIEDPVSGKRIIYLHADLGAIFQPLRDGLVSKIKENIDPDFDGASLMITASHTHCAPSGMSHYPLYMMVTPGYNPSLVDYTVNQMFLSVKQAIGTQRLSTIEFNSSAFNTNIPVAFNRALKAHNKNAEIERKFKREETHLAINRIMTMLSFKNKTGVSEGFINWFGVHPIEIGADHPMINGASKGYAALSAEKELPEGTVAIFAQSSAGDVATADFHNPEAFNARLRTILNDPNFNMSNTSLKFSEWNGQVQADKALEIQQKPALLKIQGGIDYELIYVDMSNVHVKPEFANGRKKAFTTSPCLGVKFVAGNFKWNDRNSRASALNFLGSFVSEPKAQRPKKVVINGERKTILGIKLNNYKKKKWPTFIFRKASEIDLNIKEMLRQQELDALEEHTLLPKILPIQIIRIGNVVIVGIPTEITTVAHNRLQATILKALQGDGVEQVLISSYANEYAGYTTTYEEYLKQRYEGGHTLYGKFQLGAFQTVFEKLSQELLKPKEDRQLNRKLRPPVFSEEELRSRSNLLPLK